MKKTYYQLDSARCFAFAGDAREFNDDPGRYNIPHDAVTVAPPEAPAGSVARWAGEAWEIVEDHRRATLYLADGKTYAIGSVADAGSYDGLGPIPAWLVKEAPPPPPPEPQYKTQFTPLEFLDRFSEQEQFAVVAATLQAPAVKLWYDRMLAASFVDLTDPRSADGIDALIAAGLIDPSRKAALMQPERI